MIKIIGDKLLIEQHHTDKAEFIANTIVQNKDKFPITISIAGFSGCGKSELTHELHNFLYKKNIKSFSISNDDYYLIAPGERNKHRKETGIIGHKELNWDKINKIKQGFKEQSNVYIQEYHLYSDKFMHTEFNFSGVNVFIFEGLYAGYFKSDLFFFLDANYNQTYRFRKTRGKENPDDSFRKMVLRTEADEIRKTKEKADFIIPYTFA